MARGMDRRGALRVLAASAALGTGALALRGLSDAPRPLQWQGEVMGALSALTLWHARPSVAQQAMARMRLEIDRLDRIFSLYRPESQLARLNRDGRLASPSPDLLRVLGAALGMAGESAGAFDPTMQPLWEHHASGGGDAGGLDRALALVDHRKVDAGTGGIGFLRPGMGVSLNGIAQGYITDRITGLLAAEGFETAMVELGETRALGPGPAGAPFRIGIPDPADPRRIALELPLAGKALAVSGGYGTLLPGAARHHIFDPATGLGAEGLLQVAVTAPDAMQADALSTALLVAGETRAPQLLAAHPGAGAVLWRADGTVLRI